jgi:predicted CXXCH cytochrome family protein
MRINANGGIMNARTRGLLVAGLVLLLATAAWAYDGIYTPGNGINNTPHDLPRGDNGMAYQPNPSAPDPNNLQRICIYCHAPHNTYRLNSAAGAGVGPLADDAFDYLPLWNHTLQDNYTYSPYDNGPGAPQDPLNPRASQAILNGGMTPGSTSLLCLSCHDGSVAVNAYGNSAQLAKSWSNGGGNLITDAYAIGKGNYLGNHHPIGFDFDLVRAVDQGGIFGDASTQRTGGIRDKATQLFGSTDPSNTIGSHLYANAAIGSTAAMECGSCHSVHNTGNSGETLLWVSDQNSNLCLTCHDKGRPLP